jgi:hypothetical protein
MIFTFCWAANAGEPNEKNFKVYPNPVDRGVSLTIELPAGDYVEITAILYNTVGREIHRVKTTEKTVEFNAPEVSGIYLLRIIEKQKVISVEKIVVKE